LIQGTEVLWDLQGWERFQPLSALQRSRNLW
jgi:hypothetical protein